MHNISFLDFFSQNYGFVIFENEETVQKALEKPPRLFRGTFRLNIEEKKPKTARGPGDMRGGAGDSRPGSGVRTASRGPGAGGGRGGGSRGVGRGGIQPSDSRGGGKGGYNVRR